MGETFATNYHFAGLNDDLKNMALLPEWYKQFGVPQVVVKILFPSGSEMYIGHEKEKITTQENVSIQKRSTGKKERPAKRIYNVSQGGRVQVLIPRNAALTGKMQLSPTDINKTYPLKNDTENKKGYTATNTQTKIEDLNPRLNKKN
jgi:hypothetical protein